MFLFGHAVGAPVIDQRIELVLPVDVFLRELKPGRHAHALAVAAAGGRAKLPLPRPPLPEALRPTLRQTHLFLLAPIGRAPGVHLLPRFRIGLARHLRHGVYPPGLSPPTGPHPPPPP